MVVVNDGVEYYFNIHYTVVPRNTSDPTIDIFGIRAVDRAKICSNLRAKIEILVTRLEGLTVCGKETPQKKVATNSALELFNDTYLTQLRKILKWRKKKPLDRFILTACVGK